MPQKLFRNIFLLIIANLLIKPLWIFGIDLKVQNLVGAEDYGFYFVIFNFSFLFHILLDVGINQFNNRELARNNKWIQEHFTNLLLLKLLFSGLYLLVTFLLAFSFGYTALQQKMLLFLMCNQILISIILFGRSNFTALKWYKWDAFFSIFDRVLSIVFCFGLIYTTIFGEFQLMFFIYAQTIALLLSAVLTIIVLILKGHIVRFQINFKQILPLIRKAFPYALVVLLMTIYTRIDAVMLEKLLPNTGNNEAGIYAAGYRILDALNMLPFLLASLLIPYFAKQLYDKADFSEVLWSVFQILISFCFPFVLVVLFFSNDIVTFLYPQSDELWLSSFQILLLSFPFIFLTYLFGGFLTAAAKLRVISILAIFTIILNFSLNYIFIPTHGAAGAAFATIISQAFIALAQWVYVVRNWNTNYRNSVLIRSLIYLVLNVVILYLLLMLPFTWLIKICLFTLIAIILSLVLRLIDIDKFKTL